MSFIDQSKPILITGVTGYIASWVAKYLLEDGYTVHGTVRNLSNSEKVAHLIDIEKGSKGALRLFEADLLEPNSFREAMQDCELVIHTASPFFVQGIRDPQKQLIKPAVQGTKNVLSTVNEIKSVKRVVLTSSVVAIFGDAVDIKDVDGNLFTEENWNTTSSETHQPYSFSKTLAEGTAWDMAKAQHRWNMVTINPGFVMGPSLSKRIDSTSIDFMRSMVNGKYASGVPDLYFSLVDVRDVARAHVNAGIRKDASGRHILVAGVKSTFEMAEILKDRFQARYKIPSKKLPNFLVYMAGPFTGFSWKYLKKNLSIPYKFDNTYSKTDLGIEYKSITDTLIDHVNQLDHDGLI